MRRSAVLCLVAVVVLSARPAVGDDAAATVEQLRQRVAELERENAQLREKLGLAEREKQVLAQEKEDLTAERAQLEKLAGVTSRGEQVDSAIALVETRYDAGRDATRVVFKPRRAATTGSGPFSVDHYLGVAYSYPGQSMQSPPQSVDVQVYTFMHPTSIYSSLSEVDAIIDGSESVTIPVASYEVVKTRKPAPSLKNGQTRYDEVLRLTLDEETLRRLALAQTEVVLKLPGNDVVLGRDHLAMLAGARQRISQGL